MKSTVFILAVTFSIQCFGQQNIYNESVDSCYVLNGDTISGFFREVSIENGKIEQFLRLRYDERSELFNADGIRPMLTKYDYFLIVKGQYKDGKRIGYWHFWRHNNIMSNQYEFCGGANRYGIDYRKDTVSYYKEDYLSNKKIQYINDSLQIEGEVSYLKNSVYFKCREECDFFDKTTDKLVLRGKREDLDLLLMQIEFYYLRSEK